MMKNVFYFLNINKIGGIEQFFAYLAEKYKDWDITIYYKSADPQQLKRLKQYVRVVQYREGQQIDCDTIYFCFNRDIIDKVNAKRKCLILHGDYKTMVEQGQLLRKYLPLDSRIDEYFGVSEVVCKSWTELTGKECKLVYNPFIQKPKKKILKLVYCGRLSEEKGGKLVNKLLAKLNEHNIDYLLYVYSDVRMFGNKNVVYLDTRLDAGQFLNKDNFDFIIISSKNEGYCYSLIQALSNGLPAIITPCPVFKELGCDESNSIQIDFDGENIDDIIPLLNKKYKFKYEPKEDSWGDILVLGESNYKPEKQIPIRALASYLDMELNRQIQKGDEYKVYPDRANYIVSKGFAEFV